MTAAEIIELLRQHPVCCERLGIQLFESIAEVDGFRHWLTGAGVEWCIEHDIELPVRWSDGWASPRSDSTESRTYPTFLQAMMAAIEGATP